MKSTMEKNRQAGFTLIELAIIMFIMVLITTMALLNYRSAEKRKAVQLSHDVVTSALRNAQTYALSGRQIATSAVKVFDSTSQANCPSGSRAPADYRLVFTQNTATFDLLATDVCNDVWRIEQMALPRNTIFKVNGLLIDSNASADLQFKFEPPFGKITVAKTSSFSNPFFQSFRAADVTLSYNDGSYSTVVVVDAISGRLGD